MRPTHRRFARNMRAEPTDAEAKLWYHLRDGRLNGLKFRRQVPIGGSIVDFVCYERRFAIEVDGGQHADNAGDIERDSELRRRGFAVMRFWNDDVLSNIDAVIGKIVAATTSNPI